MAAGKGAKKLSRGGSIKSANPRGNTKVASAPTRRAPGARPLQSKSSRKAAQTMRKRVTGKR